MLINVIDFEFPNQIGTMHKGKVRNNWTVTSNSGQKLLISQTTDRISVFDNILSVEIPRKGEILNAVSNFMMRQMTDIIPIWQINTPHPNIIIGKYLEMIPLEVIVRYKLLGSAWDEFEAARNIASAYLDKFTYQIGKNTLEINAKKGDTFEFPVVEYTTKAKQGNDVPITRFEILRQMILEIEQINTIDEIALNLFNKAKSIFSDKGLELLDGKIELGYDANGVLTLADEAFNSDSCRLGLPDGTDISKQVAREFILKNNRCKSGADLKQIQNISGLTEDQELEIANAYTQLYLKIFETPLPINLCSGTETAMFHLTLTSLEKL